MSHVWKSFCRKPISSLKTMKMRLQASKLRACRKKKFDRMKIQKITSVNFQVGFPSWNCKNVISKAKARLGASQVAEMMCCDQWNTLLNFETPDKGHKILYHPKNLKISPQMLLRWDERNQCKKFVTNQNTCFLAKNYFVCVVPLLLHSVSRFCALTFRLLVQDPAQTR